MKISDALVLGLGIWFLSASAYGQDADPSIACGKALADDARFSLIVKKMPLAGLEKISLEMLADETKPTDAERKQLAVWVLARNECLDSGTEYRKAHYPPEIIAAMLESNDKILDGTAELYSRKLTFGAWNKQLQSIVSDLRTKVAAIAQRIQTERAAQEQSAARQASTAAQEKAEQNRAATEHDRAIAAQEAAARAQEAMAAAQQEAVRQQQAAAEQQRRQAALQLFANSYKPIQLPPVRPATQTNCIAVGNGVNCTTY